MRHTPTSHVLAAVLAAGIASFAAARAEHATPLRLAAGTPAGTAFTYQALLLAGGAPASGSFDLELTLYDAATTPPGAAIGAPVSLGAVPVIDGLLTVEPDFGAAAFAGEARWLEVAIRPAGSSEELTVLSPRQPLDPAPAALYGRLAGDLACAGCVGSADLADAAVTLGKLGAGSGADGQVLTVTGGGTGMAWQAAPGVGGVGTAGRVAFWTAPGTLAASGVTWDTATNRLGIGTATPADQLELTGNLRLPATTATSGQIKLGTTVFAHRYGAFNAFLGEGAGNLAMTGFGNAGAGYGALAANTLGNGNTAAGAYSLNGNRSAARNTAVGAWSLFTQSFANGGTLWLSDNTAVGYEALYSNQPTGTANAVRNTAIGAGSLRANTTGLQNVAAGASALNANTVGADNTAAGFASLKGSTTASRNTAVGSQALATQSFAGAGTAWPADNTAVGYGALFSNQPTLATNGILNTAIGSQALFANSTGYRNTAAGGGSLKASTTGTDNTALGAEALLGNTTGSENVAVGSGSLAANSTGGRSTAVGTNALGSLSYDGGGAVWNAENTAVGFSALLATEPTSVLTGRQNTAVGAGAGTQNTTGAGNTFIGASTGAAAGDLANATAVGFGAVVDATNKVRIGNADVTVIEGQVPFTSPSDARLKDDILDLHGGLDMIAALRPVQFTMRGGNGRIDLGFIAQEVARVLGADYNAVSTGPAPDHALGLRYTDLIAPLVKAVQEQQAVIQSQQERIDSLETRLAALEARATSPRQHGR